MTTNRAQAIATVIAMTVVSSNMPSLAQQAPPNATVQGSASLESITHELASVTAAEFRNRIAREGLQLCTIVVQARHTQPCQRLSRSMVTDRVFRTRIQPHLRVLDPHDQELDLQCVQGPPEVCNARQ